MAPDYSEIGQVVSIIEEPLCGWPSVTHGVQWVVLFASRALHENLRLPDSFPPFIDEELLVSLIVCIVEESVPIVLGQPNQILPSVPVRADQVCH